MLRITMIILALFIFGCENYQSEKDDGPSQGETGYRIHQKLKKISDSLELQKGKSPQRLIRLWELIGRITPDNVYDVKLFDTGISAEYYAFHMSYHFDETNTTHSFNDVYVDSFKKEKIENENLYKLFKYVDTAGMHFLPMQEDIPDFQNGVLDGTIFALELKERGNYKFLVYHCPSVYEGRYNSAFAEFLEIFEKYIDTKLWRCY